jgi:acyl carrier protein
MRKMSGPLPDTELNGQIQGEPGPMHDQARSLEDQPGPVQDRQRAVQDVQRQLQLEAALLPLWREFLGSPGAAPTDNFFECGGNSLMAARLATLLTARFGKSLGPADILACPSVQSLASMLSGGSTVQPAKDSQERGFRQRNAFARMRPLTAHD